MPTINEDWTAREGVLVTELRACAKQVQQCINTQAITED